MNSAPISVIIPCYCCSQVLPRAIDSVLHQSLLPAEIILVDDASSDQGKTRRCIEEIVAKYSIDNKVNIRVRYLEVNQGPGSARNVGWDVATQPFVAFLDADDSWVTEKLAIQYGWMLQHPQFTLTCHESLPIADVSPICLSDPVKYVKVNSSRLLMQNVIPTRSVMMRNQTDFRFPAAMRYAEDYWLWLNMVTRGVSMAKINLPLAISYKREYGESGLSSNLKAMHAGVLACFVELRRQNLIGSTMFLAAHVWEKIKYLKRTLLTRVLVKG